MVIENHPNTSNINWFLFNVANTYMFTCSVNWFHIKNMVKSNKFLLTNRCPLSRTLRGSIQAHVRLFFESHEFFHNTGPHMTLVVYSSLLVTTRSITTFSHPVCLSHTPALITPSLCHFTSSLSLSVLSVLCIFNPLATPIV